MGLYNTVIWLLADTFKPFRELCRQSSYSILGLPMSYTISYESESSVHSHYACATWERDPFLYAVNEGPDQICTIWAGWVVRLQRTSQQDYAFAQTFWHSMFTYGTRSLFPDCTAIIWPTFIWAIIRPTFIWYSAPAFYKKAYTV